MPSLTECSFQGAFHIDGIPAEMRFPALFTTSRVDSGRGVPVAESAQQVTYRAAAM
jgi:hypothetical protein